MVKYIILRTNCFPETMTYLCLFFKGFPGLPLTAKMCLAGIGCLLSKQHFSEVSFLSFVLIHKFSTSVTLSTYLIQVDLFV